MTIPTASPNQAVLSLNTPIAPIYIGRSPFTGDIPRQFYVFTDMSGDASDQYSWVKLVWLALFALPSGGEAYGTLSSRLQASAVKYPAVQQGSTAAMSGSSASVVATGSVATTSASGGTAAGSPLGKLASTLTVLKGSYVQPQPDGNALTRDIGKDISTGTPLALSAPVMGPMTDAAATVQLDSPLPVGWYMLAGKIQAEQRYGFVDYASHVIGAYPVLSPTPMPQTPYGLYATTNQHTYGPDTAARVFFEETSVARP